MSANTIDGDPATVLGSAALATLDGSMTATLLMQPDGTIVHANRAARAVIAAERPFLIKAGRLELRRKADQASLSQALQAAGQAGAPAVLPLRSRQGDLTHLIGIRPLPPTGLLAMKLAGLRTAPPLPADWVHDTLALPANYAALADGLAAGENLAEFSERTGLTVGGTRTRLKKLLRQTNTRSQSDLVALLLRAATIVSPP